MSLSVGIFTYSSRPRGSVVHAACLAEALERKGARVTLYALSKAGDDFYRPLSCALRLIPAGAAPPEVDRLIRQRIAEFCSGLQESPARHQICHAEDCLAANALVLSRSALAGAALVRTVHHVEHFESPYLMDCQQRSIAAVDLVLSVSQNTQDELRAAYGREAPVISNGVDVSRFLGTDSAHRAEVTALEARLKFDPSDTVVLSVGGIEPRKNTLAALEAMERALARHERLRWVIAGGASIWEHEAYRTQFSRRLSEVPAPLRARISVLGTVSETDLTTLYRRSELLLCPSLQEGFGLCILEALAADTAVIAPKGAPFDEYLDEQCARFVDPTSVDDITRVLCGLLTDRASIRQLATQGLLNAKRYSWETVADRHLARYELLLRRGSAA